MKTSLFSILSNARIQSNTCQEEASDTDEDVCGGALREKRASESLEILKDHGDDPKYSNVDTVSARQSVAGDKTEIEIESIHRHISQGGSSEVRSTETRIECRENDQSHWILRSVRLRRKILQNIPLASMSEEWTLILGPLFSNLSRVKNVALSYFEQIY